METLTSSPAFSSGLDLALKTGILKRGQQGLSGRKFRMIPGQDVKATRILAKSLFKELRGNGYSPNQILSLSTELIDLVTQDLRGDQKAELEPPVSEAESSGAWRAAL